MVSIENLLKMKVKVLFACAANNQFHIYFKSATDYYDLIGQYSGSYSSSGYKVTVESSKNFPEIPDTYGNLYLFKDTILENKKSDYHMSYGATGFMSYATNIFCIEGNRVGITKNCSFATEKQVYDAVKDSNIQEALLSNGMFSKNLKYVSEIEALL